MRKTHKSLILAIGLFFAISASPAASQAQLANGKIAFTSDRDGNREIYVMNVDGTNQVRLTNNTVVDDHPTWSPDGTKIAFVSERPTGGFALYFMKADGTDKSQITPITFSTRSDIWDYWAMSWSPDSNRIVFQETTDPSAGTDIFIVNIDGSNRHVLINGPEDERQPSWSPDGSKILFSKQVSPPFFHNLFTVKPDGTDLRALAHDDSETDNSASWSPTGNMIAFQIFDYANFESIVIANADGSNRQLFDGGWVNPDFGGRDKPQWSPDGSKIIFHVSREDIGTEIYVKNSNGTGLAQLTNTPGNNYKPSWQRLATGACPNLIDCPDFFVRQQYLDFLNREPDQGGWDYWTAQITSCGNDVRCIHERRIGVSAAFFVELEFQRTGYVVYRMHRAAFGTWTGAPTRANLTYTQFTADRALLPEGSDIAQTTINFANAFVARPEFLSVFPANQTNAEFVNKLFDTAGLTPYTTERQQQIAAMTAGRTRAQVLLDVIEIPEFKTREYNRSFVLMEYFGYLRRDPDQGGYDFWLNVLDNREPNNFRGMVCSFITSTEYQQRFGNVITRSNQDCQQP